jgi:hypothetical protein
MAESPRRVDLRLTIPAAATFHPLAADVAEKFAECAGVERGAAQEFAENLRSSIAIMARTCPNGAIGIELCTEGRELIATAKAGSATKRTRCPLPD